MLPSHKFSISEEKSYLAVTNFSEMTADHV